MTGGDRDYVQRLGRVLRGGDSAALREFLAEQAARYGDERQVGEIQARGPAEMEALRHQMIVARPDLADLHAASEWWLANHGAVPPAGSSPTPRPGSTGESRRGSRGRGGGPKPTDGRGPRPPRDARPRGKPEDRPDSSPR